MKIILVKIQFSDPLIPDRFQKYLNFYNNILANFYNNSIYIESINNGFIFVYENLEMLKKLTDISKIRVNSKTNLKNVEIKELLAEEFPKVGIKATVNITGAEIEEIYKMWKKFLNHIHPSFNVSLHDTDIEIFCPNYETFKTFALNFIIRLRKNFDLKGRTSFNRN